MDRKDIRLWIGRTFRLEFRRTLRFTVPKDIYVHGSEGYLGSRFRRTFRISGSKRNLVSRLGGGAFMFTAAQDM